LLQADAYAGFNRLYEPNQQPGPILEAACWAHGTRQAKPSAPHPSSIVD
jgi:hypothetical protein